LPGQKRERTMAGLVDATKASAKIESGKKATALPLAPLSFDGKGVKGLAWPRRWTTAGIHPYDEIAWETRTASIGNESGKSVFEQKGVEVPA